MLKRVMLLDFLVKTVIHFSGFFKEYDIQRTTFIWNRFFFNIINFFTVIFDQFYAFLQNKKKIFILKKTLTPNF